MKNNENTNLKMTLAERMIRSNDENANLKKTLTEICANDILNIIENPL